MSIKPEYVNKIFNVDIIKYKYDKYHRDCDNAVRYEFKKVVLYNKQKNLDNYNLKSAPRFYLYIK